MKNGKPATTFGKRNNQAKQDSVLAGRPAHELTKSQLKNWLGVFIAVCSFILYSQSITFNFAYDDTTVITENILVKEGYSAIPTLLKTDFWYGSTGETARVEEYRPLPLIFFALEWQFFPDNPHAFHFINVLLYSLTCLLLFLLLCRLFKNQNLIFPFICTLLFTTHPIHTEVVNNIKSMDEILCFLFSILSINSFVRAEVKKPKLNLLSGIIFFFLSLLSKETGISYLLITPLTLFVFTNTPLKKILFVFSFLLSATALFLFIRLKVIEAIPPDSIDHSIAPYMNSLVAAPDFITQKATAFFILLQYLILLVFPVKLSYDYSFSHIPVQQLTSPGTLLGIFIYLMMGAYAIVKIKNRNKTAFAILFFLITLAPVSNIFLLIYCTMAERFLFMPSLGYCMLLTFFLIKITQTDIYKNKFTSIKLLVSGNKTIFIITLFIAGLYSVRTIARNPVWKDSVSLFSHDVNTVPNSARAHYNYGLSLLFTLYPKETDHEAKNIVLNQAIDEFTKAIAIYNNDFPMASSYLGSAYEKTGDYANAKANYETAIRLFDPISPAWVYCDLGFIYANLGEIEKSLNILDTCLKHYPRYTDLYIKKSYAYFKAGRNKEAIAECNKLLAFDSENSTAYINKGFGHLNMKQYDEAIESLNKAFQIDSTNADCLHFLGLAYQGMGDSITARNYFKKEKAALGQ